MGSGRTLVVADTVALLAFVVVGVVDHGSGIAVMPIARNLVPLLAAWFLAALAVGAYRRPGLRSLLLTWILAVPVGVVARGLLLGRPFGAAFWLFLAAGLGFTLLFLLSGRGIVWGLARPRPRVLR